MSEQTSESSAPEATEAAATAGETQAAETDWRAEAKKWESRAKENRNAARQLAEIQDAQKTDAQRQQEAMAALEQRATAAERELKRSRVASKHDLGDLAEFLTGDTDEELEEQAKRLAKRLKANPPPSYDGGARTTAPAPADMNQLIRQAAGRA